MLEQIGSFVLSAGESLWMAAQILFLSAVLFAALAVLIKGNKAIQAARQAASEARVNLTFAFLDALLVAPVIAVVVQVVRGGVSWSGLALATPASWESFGTIPTAIAVFFLGDFVSYWRHRLEHTRLLWPAHAVHHSDVEMTWLTLQRFHPINRATTSIIDIVALALLGFPHWALVANVMLRHYYGEFIHADLPWTYGPVRSIFVSPVMHRWHHARDVVGAGSNFATVFAVFDRAFGTFHLPGLCNVPLGVNDDMGQGAMGQLLYPLVAWTERLRHRRPSRHDIGLESLRVGSSAPRGAGLSSSSPSSGTGCSSSTSTIAIGTPPMTARMRISRNDCSPERC